MENCNKLIALSVAISILAFVLLKNHLLLGAVTAVFILSVCIAVQKINQKIKDTNYYKNIYVDANKFLSPIPQNLEIINLGSSQPKFAFDFSQTGILGFNFAVAPQPFEYDFRILKQYHSFLKNEAYVVIPVCPFNFFMYRDEAPLASIKYYSFLHPSLINNYKIFEKILFLHCPVFSPRLLIKLFRDTLPDVRLELDQNIMTGDQLGLDGETWVKNWKKQFGIQDLCNSSVTDRNRGNIGKNRRLLVEMLEFCQTKSYRPVFVVLPATKYLTELIPNSFIEKHVLENIAFSNFLNAPVLNYFRDPKLAEPQLYFNSFFLNKKGRQIFTAQFLNDLRNVKK